MVYEDTNAVYALNSYVWKLLEANLEWEKYQGVPPIIPIAQQPELLQSAKAFLIYGSARHPSDHLYALVTESISYTIYAPTSTEVNTVANLLADTFARQDEAAADVNEWLGVEAIGRSKTRGISFGTVRSVMVEKATPADEEGGYVSGLVMLEAKYVEENDTIQTSGFTYTA